MPITKADFDRLNVEALLPTTRQSCLAFASVLRAKADEIAAAGDVDGSEIIELLAKICSFALRRDNRKEPYGPWIIFQNRRSASIEDLN